MFLNISFKKIHSILLSSYMVVNLCKNDYHSVLLEVLSA